MCFVIHKSRPHSRIAKRNIKVLKYLVPNGTSMKSSIQNYEYKEGSQNTVPINPLLNWSSRLSSIYQGYHSYHTNHDVANLCRICYIPKRAEYYYNPASKEYVSNQIIITFKTNEQSRKETNQILT